MAKTLSDNPKADRMPPDNHPRFLKDNFQDVRFMVYDILEAVPPNDFDRKDRDTVGDFTEGEYEEYKKFQVTRKSLRLTCKQITAEWTGPFLRSTTICLEVKRAERTPWHFDNIFLPYFTKKQVGNIRRLAFNGSRNDMFSLTPHGDNRCPNLPRPDAERLRELGGILRRHIDQLQLETLDVKFCDDDSRLLWRSNEITRAELIGMQHGWQNRLYIGVFEQRMTDTALSGAAVVRLFERGAIQLFFRRPKPANPTRDDDSEEYDSNSIGSDGESSDSEGSQGSYTSSDWLFGSFRRTSDWLYESCYDTSDHDGSVTLDGQDSDVAEEDADSDDENAPSDSGSDLRPATDNAFDNVSGYDDSDEFDADEEDVSDGCDGNDSDFNEDSVQSAMAANDTEAGRINNRKRAFSEVN